MTAKTCWWNQAAQAGIPELQACRRLPDVLEAHAGTVEIVHRLRPFGVIMAGENEFDPFKD